jgi:hypothetical protein
LRPGTGGHKRRKGSGRVAPVPLGVNEVVRGVPPSRYLSYAHGLIG